MGDIKNQRAELENKIQRFKETQPGQCKDQERSTRNKTGTREAMITRTRKSTRNKTWTREATITRARNKTWDKIEKDLIMKDLRDKARIEKLNEIKDPIDKYEI